MARMICKTTTKQILKSLDSFDIVECPVCGGLAELTIDWRIGCLGIVKEVTA